GVILMLRFSDKNVKSLSALLRTKSGRWFAGLLCAQWASAALSTLLSTHRAVSLNGSIWRRWGFLSETALLAFTLLCATWLSLTPSFPPALPPSNRERIRALLRAIAASGAAASVYGILQYFGWDPLIPAQSYVVGEGVLAIVRPPGTLGHADYFANWL